MSAIAPEKETRYEMPGGTAGKIRWLAEHWRPHRGLLFALFAATLISSAVAIAYPLAFKFVLDRLASAEGTQANDVERALRSVLWLLGAIAVGRFLAGLYPGLRGWVNLKFDLDVRREVFAAILEKDYRFFGKFRTGDLSTRLLDDIVEYPKIAWFSCSGLFRALDSGSKLVFCVAAMFVLNWKLSLLSVIPLPIILWSIYAVRQKLSNAYDEQQRAISATNDMLESTFSGVRIVKAFRAEEGQSAALGRVLEHRAAVQYRVSRLWAIFQILESAGSRMGQLIVLGVGGLFVLRQELSLGTLYALYIYLDMLVQPMMDLPNLLVTSRQAFICIDREEEVVRFPVGARSARPGEVQPGESLPRIESLSFRDVAFAYNGSDAVSGLDFEFRRGEKIAIVGPVAAGKTTLLRLVTGLLEPTRGEVWVNGRPLSEWSLTSYRDRIGYAPQESLLFSESIRENVELGRTGAERSENGERSDALASALQIAQMGPELEQMPLGVETMLGQKGTLVSGGQRQRISIARALHARPEVLLLDDCTASLDAENEDHLWAGIHALLPQAIVISVSHRLATIRLADRILVLDGGKMVDHGTHLELKDRCVVYRRFLEREEERTRVLGDGRSTERGGE